MNLRSTCSTYKGTVLSFTVKHTVVMFLLFLSNPVAGPVLKYNSSSTHCFPNGEILYCSFTDDQYFPFYICPENFYWTKQFRTTDNVSITGNLICQNCPLGTSKSKTHHWDEECDMPFNSARSSVSPSTESCFPQWDYLRCRTDSGDWTEFLICTEDRRWTGKFMHSDLECVKCPSNMHIPYTYHFNTTCISARKESSHESTNSIPTMQSNIWSILISFGLALLF